MNRPFLGHRVFGRQTTAGLRLPGARFELRRQPTAVRNFSRVGPLLLVYCTFTLCPRSSSLPLAQEPPPYPLGPPSTRTGLLLTDTSALKLIHMSSGDLARQYVSQLALWSRVEETNHYREAAEWVARKATEFHLQDVHIERFPTDGTTRYFNYPSKRFWDVRRAELWMSSPFEVRLTSFAELPHSLCRNSTSADAEGEIGRAHV